ncbi:MAG: 3-methyl-2-oxobutanoate hydroxymethyltransferase [Phenylobacterium sp.]|jgi:3-methyl-2-oxobutanoate hydroxymethyltransferase|uniref:3-methyl-2-oxobutanoate hydroxymethyltransferase n=1 Tax=Phenylobacterium sp. TaxID=1871053 RepID=UPI001B474941|nr:3-methyl-2-oxobutanoate hydroxymethyltransferase [Phenylobacterium sp.]MBP7651074.1 3-methyl-2-oxobutanoate hydroxymethyltransferase [Phenylobacterium sp.]MBP7814976.1 3-methyl-2-oxobutanoate hydroxymethyltransferase [Phenylobacterium sp.]MBP9230087.1 3-methyl-2-oxobutanoate hydroxymethyltransferase [Phenylobacterium sp.]MBP9755020.1 3-methyl-2-oxobutanoate hydroxymethyltransferase [Phenylobacterium sp.]MBP9756448.1 3-methyl-2-oxobutanoate hydroxymethyltransferase [Phenylobacterium sp.]
MSAQRQETVRRLAAPDITARKGGVPIVCLTAYTAPMAELLDDHCDLLLVGDSVGMVVHGLPNTVGVTLEMMILHGQAVMRTSKKAMVVVDMPFGSYEGAPEIAYQNAVRIMKETGASAVKVESGSTVVETIEYLVKRGVPVMGHVGLRPQAVLVDGGFKAKGRAGEERARILEEAKATAAAGAFAVVVEGVAEGLAREITETIAVPTIGIGASAGCDGQILVTDDMLGLFDWTPKFVRRYADLRGEISKAIAGYADDVRQRNFPGPAEIYFAKAANT